MADYHLIAETGIITAELGDAPNPIWVDTEIARLYEVIGRVSNLIHSNIEMLHHYVGDKSEWKSYKVQEWKMTTAEVENAEPKAWYVKDYASTKAKLVENRAEYRRLADLLDIENAKYTGWSRFFLVTGGHIHKTMTCSTCYPTTQYGWLPQLSGLTEKDAVDAHGPLLCSICYPTAPVEWTVGPQTTKDYCTGSGKAAGGTYRDRYVRCPDCGKSVARTKYGDIRKHMADKSKATKEE